MVQNYWRLHRRPGWGDLFFNAGCADITCPKDAATCRKGTHPYVALFESAEGYGNLTLDAGGLHKPLRNVYVPSEHVCSGREDDCVLAAAHGWTPCCFLFVVDARTRLMRKGSTLPVIHACATFHELHLHGLCEKSRASQAQIRW